MKTLALVFCFLGTGVAMADILVPARTIRAKEIIAPEDMLIKKVNIPGALSALEDGVGIEARVALYPGRPVRRGDVGPAAIVGRNDIVPLVFVQGGLQIMAEGRALGRGAAGEVIQVMNMSSRTTISGRIRPDGSIEVQ